MVVTSTKAQPGTFSGFIQNVGANIQAAFTPKTTTIVTTSTGQKALVPTGSGGITTTSSPTRVLSGGGGGSGGGSSSQISTLQGIPTQVTPVTQRVVAAGGQSITTQQAIASRNAGRQDIPGGIEVTRRQPTPFTFSGKVEESFKEQPQATQYYVGGESVGRTYVEGSQEYAEIKKPARLTFQRGDVAEQVSITPQQVEVQTQTLTPADVSNIISGYVSEAPKLTGIEGLYQGLSAKRSEIYTKSYRTGSDSLGFFGLQIKGFGIGVAQSFVGTGVLFKNLITNPFETIKNIPTGLKQTYSFASSGELSRVIKTEPGYASGFVAAEVIQYQTPKIITTGVDIIRTRGLTKIGAADVIAPEYFAGQTYPKIKPGQTAGSLLEEFRQPSQAGVTKLTGFTATPIPFPKETKALIGGSEFAGVYQAPKVSPQFLRIATSERKLFTLNPFKTTLRPTIVQIIPDEFVLAPGVSYRQSKLASLQNIKSVWGDLDLGKSYVTFVKTEKEAIIPAGTGLSRTGKYFYIPFEGRRVPIVQYTTKIGEGAKVLSTSDITKISSRSRVGSSAYISSYDVLNILPSTRQKVSRTTSFQTLPPYSLTNKDVTFISPRISKRIGILGARTSYSPLATPSKSSMVPTSSLTRIPRTPSYLVPRSYPPRVPPGYPRYPTTPKPPKTPKPIRFKDYYPKTPTIFKPIKLFVKEKGQFKFKGLFSDVYKASDVGRYLTGGDITRSYKLEGGAGILPTGYRYARRKGKPIKDIFVELSKTSLSQPLEQRTIKSARRAKSSTRKKRK